MSDTSSQTFNIDSLVNLVSNPAESWEESLSNLTNTVNGGDSGDMSSMIIESTDVQVSQSILELAQGVAKNATDQVKKSGTTIAR